MLIFKILLAFILVSPLMAKEGIDSLKGLRFGNAKIPVYQRGNLQMMIFTDSGFRSGKVIHGDNVVLELIRKGADIDEISDAWSTKPYALGADLAEILDFWRTRMAYSDGVMTSVKGEVDQDSDKASGNERVYFRSPAIDLNGIGFEADFKQHTIRVNSDIDIVMRKSSADPGKIISGGKMPEKYEYITALGDSLLIDSSKKQIMLIGNVDVKENDTRLVSERLTVFHDSAADKSSGSAPENSDLGGGIRALLADGEVVMSDAGGQKIYSDHLLYDLASGKVTLSCDEGRVPKIVSRNGEEVSGESIRYLRNQQHILIDGKCRGVANSGKRSMDSDRGFFDLAQNSGWLKGNVRLQDEATLLLGPQMNFFLSGGSGEKNTAVLAPGSTGGRELEKVIFPEKVTLLDRNKSDFSLDADTGIYSKKDQRIDLNGNVRMDNGDSRLDCREMQVFIVRNAKTGKEEIKRVLCSGGRVRIVSVNPATGRVESTLTADKAEFFEDRDLAVFTGKVNLKDQSGILDCDRLELYLDSTGAGKDERVIGAGSGKKLKTAVAVGNVHMKDTRSALDTDRMTIIFRPAVQGEAKSGGMMHSGSSKMQKIICEGNVRGTTNDTSSSAMFGALGGSGRSGRSFTADRSITDIDRNFTELHGKVTVRDEATKLDCDHMYLYGKKVQPQAVAAAQEVDDIDADPFAIADTESFAPSRVVINSGSELEKIVCNDNVAVTSRQSDGKLVRAEGDNGIYVVADKRFIITALPQKMCRIRGEGKLQKCEMITYDLLRERFTGSSRSGQGQYIENDPDPIPGL